MLGPHLNRDPLMARHMGSLKGDVMEANLEWRACFAEQLQEVQVCRYATASTRTAIWEREHETIRSSRSENRAVV